LEVHALPGLRFCDQNGSESVFKEKKERGVRAGATASLQLLHVELQFENWLPADLLPRT
jgi:hypothetical protein